MVEKWKSPITVAQQAKAKIGHRSMVFCQLCWYKNSMHLCCLLKNDMNAKRSNQSKSALYKQALFSFPSLSFFATAVLYLLVFEFSIVIVNCVKELGPFCLARSQNETILLSIQNICSLDENVQKGNPKTSFAEWRLVKRKAPMGRLALWISN